MIGISRELRQAHFSLLRKTFVFVALGNSKILLVVVQAFAKTKHLCFHGRHERNEFFQNAPLFTVKAKKSEQRMVFLVFVYLTRKTNGILRKG